MAGGKPAPKPTGTGNHALVYSSDGKLLAEAIIEDMSLRRGELGALPGQGLMLGAQLEFSSGKLSEGGYIGQARVEIVLTPEAVHHLEALRRADRYRRVLVKLKLRFMRLVSEYTYEKTLAPLDEESKYTALKMGGLPLNPARPHILCARGSSGDR